MRKKGYVILKIIVVETHDPKLIMSKCTLEV